MFMTFKFNLAYDILSLRGKGIMEKTLFIQTVGLTKKFGDVVAVDNVDMDVFKGEIRGLIGENGSGKSTISSMISGIHTITSGKIMLDGNEFRPSGALDARNHKISMIVQEMGTIDGLTVAENIFLGEEGKFGKAGFVNRAKMNAEAAKALAKIGLERIRPEDSINAYSFEDRKLVEIARAVYYDPELFIVDETTTALSQDGRDIIHSLMRQMRDTGKAVLFISHDLPELMEICDALTVLRDGKLIATIERKDFDEDKIKQTMVGRVIEGNYYRSDYDFSCSNEVMLEVKDVEAGLLKDLNVTVHAGEIVGIGGLSGGGMHDVGKVMFGMLRLKKGEVTAFAPAKYTFKEKIQKSLSAITKKPYDVEKPVVPYKINSIKHALQANIGYISKDRDKETLILQASIKDNLTLSALDELAVCGIITPWAEKKFAKKQVEGLRIKCSSMRQPVKELSGGNKQKVSFGKWIGKDSKILVFDSPTRGVDVGVKTTMYQLLYRLKKEGYAIVIISEELPELIGMSDRMLIVKDGEVTKEFTRSPELKESDIIGYMI